MKIINIFKRMKTGELPNITYMFKKIWEYAGTYSEKFNVSRIYLFVDYFVCAMIYGCRGEDYFICRFFRLSRKQKKQFVTELYQTDFEKKYTDSVQADIIDNKEKSLDYFSDFIERDWCGTVYNSSSAEYQCFYEKHERAIIKPINGNGGHGIEIVNLKERFPSADAFRDYCIDNQMIAEELILQHEAMNRVYPNAINTIRMVTLKGKVVGAALRMGVGEACVDNAHSGGIYAEINVANGTVTGSAMNHKCEQFSCHPTTKVEISGIAVPFWEECKAMVERASCLVPAVYLIAWDIAITPAGPTLVESNTGPGLRVIQAPNGHGLKAEFEKIKD